MKMAGEYPDEKAYADALKAAGLEVPKQVQPVEDEEREHEWLWPCPCSLPWWGFRRDNFHMYIMPDGREYAYERCEPSSKAAEAKAMEERLRREEQERKNQQKIAGGGSAVSRV